MNPKKIARIILLSTLLTLAIPLVSAAPSDKVDGFVCPVLGGKGGENAYAMGKGKFVQPEPEYYSIIGPSVSVPAHATNMDGDGNPHGPYSSPGDTDYTAIWG